MIEELKLTGLKSYNGSLRYTLGRAEICNNSVPLFWSTAIFLLSSCPASLMSTVKSAILLGKNDTLKYIRDQEKLRAIMKNKQSLIHTFFGEK